MRKGKSMGAGWRPMFASDEDAAVRNLIAEAGGEGPTGMQGVAEVMRNRMTPGKSVRDVVLAPSQFSSWNPRGKENIAGQNAMKIDPNSPLYKQALETWRGVASHSLPDITNGATHYLNEAATRAARAGHVPGWVQKLAPANSLEVGKHRFVGQVPGYAPPPAPSREADQSLLAARGGSGAAPRSQAMDLAMATGTPTKEPLGTMMAAHVAPEAPKSAPLALAPKEEPMHPAAFDGGMMRKQHFVDAPLPPRRPEEFMAPAAPQKWSAPMEPPGVTQPQTPHVQELLHAPVAQGAPGPQIEGMATPATTGPGMSPGMSAMSPMSPGVSQLSSLGFDGSLGNLLAGAFSPGSFDFGSFL